jgi:ribosomal protein S18 acetylase RimI-like enzyme
MSAVVVASRVVLRAESDADLPFLRGLFATTRAAELALLPDVVRPTFCDQQFTAQHRGHRARYPHAAFDVIELEGTRVGRLAVDRSDVVTIVDIAVLPERRGRGIATAALRPVLAEASVMGQVVELHVAVGNPAADWYARLGFEPTADDGVYTAMRRLPERPAGGGRR